MISRLHLSSLLLTTAVVSGLVLIVSGVEVKAEWLTSMSATITVMSLFLLAFQHWVWRWRWLQGWFVEKPDLNGTWQVELTSTWVDPATGKTAPSKTAYLSVRQTYSHFSLRLLTDESNSELVGASIQRATDGAYQVTGVYRGEPQLMSRGRNPIHYGAVLLNVHGDPPSELIGQYWTDRDSRGQLSSSSRSSRSWFRPEARRKGHLKRRWRQLRELHGDFLLSHPLSDGMKAFLTSEDPGAIAEETWT